MGNGTQSMLVGVGFLATRDDPGPTLTREYQALERRTSEGARSLAFPVAAELSLHARVLCVVRTDGAIRGTVRD